MAASNHIKIVETISINKTEIMEDSKKKQFTVYTMVLKNPFRTWYTQRRYNEFYDFDAKIKALFPSLQADLPPKTFFNNFAPEVISFRKLRLEAYCQSLLDTFGPYNKGFWLQSEVKAFFNISAPLESMIGGESGIGIGSKSSNNLDNSANSLSNLNISMASPSSALVISEQTWMSELKRGEKMIVEIRHYLLHGKDDNKISHDSSAAKRIYTQLSVHLNELAKSLKQSMISSSNNVLPAELTRRQDLLNDLIRDKDSLTKNVFNPRSTIPASASASRNSHTEDRESLLNSAGNLRASSVKSVSSSSSKRVFGLQETDQTKELDNQGVVKLQQQILSQQDQDLDKLLDVIKRQKEIGVTINNELDQHNNLLQGLEKGVDDTALKMSQVNRRAKKLK